MISRRQFLRTLATLPPAMAAGDVFAAPEPSRLALVIGNNAYRQSPLLNPVNDARVIGKLLGDAGFSVTSLLDARRDALQAAVGNFVRAAEQSTARDVLFYYAGHAVQLDWCNYLLPVDAEVTSAEQVKSRCYDLNALLGAFARLKGKTFIIVLDACRDNPFGDQYKPAQKGLSQFDAPVGSLLAYATAPGRVASDGTGSNGLYTEHLARELSVRNVRLEDALKRVRLNVRLASGGAQVPWETTSLEGDFYLFPEGEAAQRLVSREKVLDEDIAAYTRIQNSRDAADWIAYLRQFPNGNFAEIAQLRLARIQGGGPVTAKSPTESASSSTTGAVLPQVRNEADYAALAQGALYLDPNGRMRRKS